MFKTRFTCIPRINHIEAGNFELMGFGDILWHLELMRFGRI